MERPRLELDLGLSYRDLYEPASLARLDGIFPGPGPAPESYAW